MSIKIILSAILIPPGIMLIFSLLGKEKSKKSKKMTDDNFAVMIPNIAIIVGTLLVIEALALLLGFTFLSAERPHFIFYLFVGLFLWFGIYLIIRTISFKVVVKKEKITVFSFLRKEYSFTFDEIVSVVRQVKKNKVKSERLIIKTCAGKKLIVENAEISYDRFKKVIISKVKREILIGF